MSFFLEYAWMPAITPNEASGNEDDANMVNLGLCLRGSVCMAGKSVHGHAGVAENMASAFAAGKAAATAFSLL